MSDNKREQERTELYRTIWALANELRGSVDGWDFKQYVLGMLFYRYISENLTTYLNKGEWEAGNTDFDYAKISDEEALSVKDDMVQEKGFFILPSELFGNLLNRIRKADKDAKDQAEKDGKEVEIADLDENLNEILQTNFKNIEASAIGSPSEENFKGLFDDIDVNSNKLGPDTFVDKNGKTQHKSTERYLKEVNEKRNIIPAEFSNDGYRLFRELSGVVHGNCSEKEALLKFNAFYRLVPIHYYKKRTRLN